MEMDLESNLLRSNKFLIRYCDESVEIHNIGIFRMETDFVAESLLMPLHLYLDLY